MEPSNSPESGGSRERRLLYFGLDMLILNICRFNDSYSRQARFIDGIFAVSHNWTNTNEIGEMDWPSVLTNETGDHPWEGNGPKINIVFSPSPDGEVAQVFSGGEYIFQILKVNHTSPHWMNTRYDYKYRVTFYSKFFNACRRGDFGLDDFFGAFKGDEKCLMSVSRIDVCADVAHISVKEVLDGIRGTHLKRVTKYEEDMATGELETFYYGRRSVGNNGFVRVYDKLEDSRKKKKEKLYREYFQIGQVTRIEAEMKSGVCSGNANLENVKDLKFLWSLFAGFIKDKYKSWKIYPFLEGEMRKMGFERMVFEKKVGERFELSQERAAKRLGTGAIGFFDRYKENPMVYLLERYPEFRPGAYEYLIPFFPQTGTGLNPKLLPKSGESV